MAEFDPEEIGHSKATNTRHFYFSCLIGSFFRAIKLPFSRIKVKPVTLLFAIPYEWDKQHDNDLRVNCLN